MTDPQATAFRPIAEYYDLMTGGRSADIEYFSGLLRPGQRSIIDLGCGTGAVVAGLAAVLRTLTPGHPVRVAGLDGSADMLTIARRTHGDSIDWIEGDLRTLTGAGSYELAISCYNTLQHLDKDGLRQCFHAARRILEPGGRLAFDIYQPNFEYLRKPYSGKLARELADQDGSPLEIREDASFDERESALDLAWSLVEAGLGGRTLAQTRYRLWQHPHSQVRTMLAEAGFEIVAIYGGLDRQLFTPQSKKQVVVSILR